MELALYRCMGSCLVHRLVAKPDHEQRGLLLGHRCQSYATYPRRGGYPA